MIPESAAPGWPLFQPERVWQYQDQEGEHRITEHEIIQQMYAWWAEGMMRVGKPELISPENCIADFVVVHWAAPPAEEWANFHWAD